MKNTKENFEDFKVNRYSERRNTIRQKREFKDSIFLKPGAGAGIKLQLGKELENFNGLPGVEIDNKDNSDDEFHLINEDNVDLFRNRLTNEVELKHWVYLISCSVLSSSLTPFMLCMRETICFKLFWTFILVFIISVSVMSKIKLRGYEKNDMRKFYDTKMIKDLMMPSLCFIAWIFCIVFSCHYDNISHSLVFANSHTFIIAIINLVRGEKTSMYEKMGVLISFVGLLIIAYDDNTLSFENAIYNLRKVTVEEKLLKGNLVGFIGSGFAVIFFLRMKKQMREFHVIQKMYVTSLIGIPLFLLLSLVIIETKIEQHFFLSFLTFKNFTLIFLIASLSIMMSNYFLYILNNIFNKMTVSIAMQLQPLFASFIIFFLGQQAIPGYITFFGMICFIPGLILLKIEQNYKETDDFINYSDHSNSLIASIEYEVDKARELALIY